MNKWIVYAMVSLGMQASSLFLPQGCAAGTVQLNLRTAYSGTIQYYYNDSHSSPEWINVCGRNWNQTLSQLACRDILNSSSPIQSMVAEYEAGEVVNRSILLDCNGQSQISSCHSYLMTESCSTVNVTCKGSCINSICTCSTGYGGFNCNASCTPGCANGGQCIFPDECSCTPGWQGDTCMTPICTHNCSNRGNCTGPNICNCDPGWTGNDCAQVSCENGVCIAHVYSCSQRWNGTTCIQSKTLALCPSGCANGGQCIYPDQCSCTSEWEGDRCATPICPNNCSSRGRCIGPNTCSCNSGWTGNNCLQALCDSPCENGDCMAPGFCNCSQEWHGANCSQAICSDGFCLNGGNCSDPDVSCTCTDEWEGNQCQSAICSDGFCLNEGNCSDPDVSCTCTEEWEGNQCQSAICSPIFCKNGGTCFFPNINCTCPFILTGDTCEEVNYFIVTLALATILFLVVVLVIMCNIRKKCKKSKKKEKDARALFGDNIQQISSPIVNPFLNEGVLKMASPCGNETPNCVLQESNLKEDPQQQTAQLIIPSKDENPELPTSSSKDLVENFTVDKYNQRSTTANKHSSFLLQVPNISYNVFKREGRSKKKIKEPLYYEVVILGNKTTATKTETSTASIYDYADANIRQQ